jgi:hypothetical protein
MKNYHTYEIWVRIFSLNIVMNSTIKNSLKYCVEQIDQTTKKKLIETMKTNNPNEREEHNSLFTQFDQNKEQPLCFTIIKESLYKKFPIGLQELILILPKFWISSRGQKTQFDQTPIDLYQ